MQSRQLRSLCKVGVSQKQITAVPVAVCELLLNFILRNMCSGQPRKEFKKLTGVIEILPCPNTLQTNTLYSPFTPD